MCPPSWGHGVHCRALTALLLPLMALVSLQKKEDKKVVNGKAAEQEDVPGMQPATPLGCLQRHGPVLPPQRCWCRGRG